MKEKRTHKDKTETNKHFYESKLSETDILILRVMYQTNVAVPMLLTNLIFLFFCFYLTIMEYRSD